jgi:SAM-dependent methyltransferase
MLRKARRRVPQARLAQADLRRSLPISRGLFDALLCALVSEHLEDIHVFFSEALSALRPGGRLVFSAFHPAPAAAGIEANFERGGTEYRLGARRYATDDYLNRISDAGFRKIAWSEYSGDAQLANEVPSAAKYLGHPLLLIVRAVRPLIAAAR